MKLRILLLFFCIISLPTFAQKRVLIYDLETKVPIRQARVRVDRARTFTANYTGQIMLPAKFDSIIVTHPKYLSLTLAAKNVGDSIGLIPKTHTLGEVEVIGEDLSKKLQQNVESWLKTDREKNAMQNVGAGGASFDIVEVFDFKGKARRKRTRKVKEALIKMDETEKDPIKRAYKEAIKNKQREEEEKEETTK